MRFAILSPEGLIARTGKVPEADLVHQLFNPGERILTEPPEELAADGRWAWDEAQGYHRREETAAQVAVLRADALRAIDREAEAARAAFLTAGSGQAQEYRITEEEARRLLAPGAEAFSADAYPMLAAEVAARGEGTDPAGVAALVLDRAAASVRGLAAIKEARRRAKVAVMTATTAAGIGQARTTTWPSAG